MSTAHARYRRIPLDQIVVLRDETGPLNPRGESGSTVDLQMSLQVVGQVEPIIVDKPGADGRWPLIDGHRRLVAFHRLLAEATTDHEREQWASIAAVERAPQAPIMAAMLATHVREPIKPSRVGRALVRLSREERWTLERAARALGLTPTEADLYVRAAGAPANVQARLDSGELAWSTWKRKVARLPAALQEQVAAMEDPTGDRVARAVKAMARPATDRMLDDETLITRANEARALVQALLDLQPWGEEIADRLTMILDDIHGLTRQEEHAL